MPAAERTASLTEIDLDAVRAELTQLVATGQPAEVIEAAMRLLAAKLKLEQERDEYRKLVLHLKEENERLRRGLLGQKAERLPRNDAQLSLAILALAMAGAGGSAETEAAAAEVDQQLVAQHTRRKRVRKPLPKEL